MFDEVKEFFKYNRTERYGTFALMLIIALVILFNKYSHHFIKPEPPDPALMQALIDSIEKNLASEEEAFNSATEPVALFSFNPNTLPDSGYKQLGFTDREIQTLRNYMGKGGNFKLKKDFARLYFVDEARYQQLEPYILLPEDYPKTKYTRYPDYKKDTTTWSDTALYSLYKYEPKTADINWSDTVELKELRGLGPYFAKKIVEHRKALGGYYSLSQLLEIYGMTPGRIDTLAPYLTMDTTGLKKLDINHISTQDLARHPYLSFKEANAIVLYRTKHGPFSSWSEMQKANLVNGERSRKIAPYLIFIK